MGSTNSSENKDVTVVIYVTLSKRVYYGGELVEGAIHIDCKANRPYNQLFLRIEGTQNVHWQERYGKGSVHYTNYRQTYTEIFEIAQFSMGIKTGQYTFPFKILLPSGFPATLQVLDSSNWHQNYIRSAICAYLPAYDDKSEKQEFRKALHLRENSRLPQKTFLIQQISEAKCWSCCCTCGSASLTLQGDSIAIMQNEAFHVKGIVDNSRGTTKIKSFKIVLKQVIKEISESEFKRYKAQDFILYKCQNEVAIGTSLPFEVQLKVPIEVLGYTAIGNIIYRAYFLELVAEVNCCYSNPKVAKAIILNNTIQPPVEESELKQAPQRWNPNVANTTELFKLKPYIYDPSNLVEILVRNQQSGVVNLTSMNMESYVTIKI